MYTQSETLAFSANDPDKTLMMTTKMTGIEREIVFQTVFSFSFTSAQAQAQQRRKMYIVGVVVVLFVVCNLGRVRERKRDFVAVNCSFSKRCALRTFQTPVFS